VPDHCGVRIQPDHDLARLLRLADERREEELEGIRPRRPSQFGGPPLLWEHRQHTPVGIGRLFARYEALSWART
jgi:hypothetical protein